jgi:beta-lactamase class A
VVIDLPPAERIDPIRPPVIVAPGPRQASFGDLVARLDPATTSVVVTVNGEQVAAVPVSSERLRLRLRLPQEDVTIRLIARSGSGSRSTAAVGPVYGLARASRPTSVRGAEDPALARRIRALALDFPGTAAVYVQNLRTGRGAAWNARARFPAASTLKLGIAVELLRVLRSQPAPQTRLGTLLRKMIVYSDNAAANSLLVWLGGSTSGGAARVNATMRALGLVDSHMYGGYILGTSSTRPIPLRVESQPAFGVGKYTTAWDLARLHAQLHLGAVGRGRLTELSGSFTAADARHVLYLLAHVRDPGKLDRFIRGTEVSVLHKSGWIRHARHDSGLVYWSRGSFVVAVMTWNGIAEVGTSGDVLAGRVARAALRRFNNLAGAPWESLSFKARAATA